MSLANWGIGISSAGEGLARGLQAGSQARGAMNRMETNTIRREGLASAEDRREEMISGNMEQLPGPVEGWRVGDETYTDQEEARGAASEDVPSQEDLFIENAVPRLREKYIEQGDLETAQLFDEWTQQRKNQKAMKDWSKGYMAMQSGNWEEAAKVAGEFYNENVDDGTDFVGHDTLKDDDGNVTGFTMRLKDKESGEVSEVPMDRQRMVDMVRASNPQALFESEVERLQTQQETEREAESSALEHQRNLEEITHQEQQEAEYASGEDMPANVRTAQWLMDNDVAENPDQAWTLTNMSTTRSREDFALEYADMLTRGQSGFGADEVSADDAFQRGLEIFDGLQSTSRESGGRPAPGSGGQPAPGGQPGRRTPAADGLPGGQQPGGDQGGETITGNSARFTPDQYQAVISEVRGNPTEENLSAFVQEFGEERFRSEFGDMMDQGGRQDGGGQDRPEQPARPAAEGLGERDGPDRSAASQRSRMGDRISDAAARGLQTQDDDAAQQAPDEAERENASSRLPEEVVERLSAAGRNAVLSGQLFSAGGGSSLQQALNRLEQRYQQELDDGTPQSTTARGLLNDIQALTAAMEQ